MGSLLETLLSPILQFILSLFGNIDLSPVATAVEIVKPYIQLALYILPAQTIAQILSIIITIYSFRLTIKTIRLVFEFIPFF